MILLYFSSVMVNNLDLPTENFCFRIQKEPNYLLYTNQYLYVLIIGHDLSHLAAGFLDCQAKRGKESMSNWSSTRNQLFPWEELLGGKLS